MMPYVIILRVRKFHQPTANRFSTARKKPGQSFEAPGTPSNSENFDSNFLVRVTASIEDIFKICSEDPAGALCTPLEYEEVVRVCSNLKPGVSDVSLDYEHIRFAGLTLWNYLFLLYQDFFQTHTVPENLKTGVILPFLKDKGAKANNKDNYRGITMFLLSVKYMK